VSIVRVGLAETKHFSEGYEAIFGKKAAGTAEPEAANPETASPPRVKGSSAGKGKGRAKAKGRQKKPPKKARK
jgi:hypothetical protein